MLRKPHKLRAFAALPIVLASAFAATGCGGGGGGGSAAASLPAQVTLTAPARAEPGAELALSSSLGTGSDGLTLSWDFGDGSTSTQAQPRHTYAAPGSYDLSLSVRNGAGQIVSGHTRLQVGRFGMVADRLCSGDNSSGWCWQAPLPDVQSARTLRFFTPLVGVAAGESGWFEITVDGGKTWTRRPRQAFGFADVAMLDADNGWALSTDFQAVHRTRDGGRSWERKPVDLRALGNNAARLLLLGGERLMVTVPPGNGLFEGFITHDGAATWSLAPNPTTAVSSLGAYWSVVVVPSLRGFPPDTYRYARFADWGATPTPVGPLPGRCRAPVLPVDEQRVWAACSVPGGLGDALTQQPRIFGSDDSGRSWRELQVQIPASSGYSWSFTDVALDAHGVGFGVLKDFTPASPQTYLLRASDGATVWRPLQLPPVLEAFILPSKPVIDSATLWLVSDQQKAWFSDDGGLQWRPIDNAAESARPQTFTRDAGSGWLAEYYESRYDSSGGLAGGPDVARTYRSTNGGQTWYRVPGGRGSEPFLSVMSLWFLDARRGLALIHDGSLRVTNDGGRTWSRRAGDSLSRNRFGNTGSLQFTSSGTGWFINIDELKTSTDAGLTWARATVPDEMDAVVDVQFVNPLRGWAVTKDGQFFSTSDGGQRWVANAQPAGATRLVRRVRFFDERIGVLVASEGDIDTSVWHTGDGGRTWRATNFNRGGGGIMSQLVYADAANVWMSGTHVVGESLWRSGDGGATWQPVKPPLEASVEAVHFVDAQRGWVITAGAMFATIDAGATWSAQAPRDITVSLRSMFWLDAQTGWLGGDAAAILATATGGR